MRADASAEKIRAYVSPIDATVWPRSRDEENKSFFRLETPATLALIVQS